jgi:hypothetical protein
MTAPADLVVTQLSVEAGEAQESADFITVSRPSGFWPIRRRSDQFCALLAPTRPGQGALCRQLLDLMEREFAASGSRSATSALNAVLQAAHDYLRRENAVSLPEERVTMGAAVAVLRGGGAYIGRVGPTFAAVRHGGQIQRFAGPPARTSDTEGIVDDGGLLGEDRDLAIAYGFSPFEPNDLLVLASGPQWETLREDYFAAALAEGEPSAVASALYELGVWRQTRPTFSLLVVEAREPERRGWLTPAPPVEEEAPEFSDAAPPRPRPRGAVRGRVGVHAYRRGDGWDDAPAPRGAPASDSYGAARGRWWESPDPLTRLRQVLGGARKQPAPLPPRVLLVGLLAVALAVLVGLALVLPRVFRPPPDPATALYANAQSLYEQARRAPDAPGTREQLDTARQQLQSSLRLREDARARALLTEVQGELDRLDRVVRLPTTPPLIDLAPLGPETSVTRVVVAGTDIYILDVGGARLLRYQLAADGALQTPEPTVLVQRGQQVANRPVGALINMAWVGAGGPRTDPGLIVVESGRTFVTYNPTAQLGRIVPADNMRWNAITAMTAYQGIVYLVDPERPALLEYRPTRGGYEGAPTAPLGSGSGLDWPQVVDLSADANSFYILQANGLLRKFAREGGQPQPFDGRVPDNLRGPVAVTLVGSGVAQTVYVADAGNERVVQYSPDGVYQRQFRAPPDTPLLQGLRDVLIDVNNRLYVLTARALYRFELPE